MSRITVRLDSVRQWFPSGIDVPPLLAAFGRWVDAIPHGTLGYFDALAGESLDESFVRDPATLGALRARLGIFLLLPEGSRLALWDYGGPSLAVVWIGSEGGQRHVAATLEDFLIALSAGATGVSDLDDRDASAQRGAHGVHTLGHRAMLIRRSQMEPDVDPPDHQHVAVELHLALRLRDQSVTSCRDLTRLQRASEGPGESTGRGADDIVERGGVRLDASSGTL